MTRLGVSPGNRSLAKHQKKLVKHKNHGTIAINIHQVEENHHVETMSQL
jgi:hypothetical protein